MRKAVAAYIRNKEEKFLLLYHKEQDYWTPPGGKVEEPETNLRAIIRELKEEVNFEIPSEEYSINLNIVKVTETITHECGDYNWLLNIYCIRELPSTFLDIIKNNEPEKHTDMKWFSIDEIKKLENISYSTKLLLGMYKSLDEYVEWATERV